MERGKTEGHKRQKEKTLSNLENTDIRRREGTGEQVQEKNSKENDKEKAEKREKIERSQKYYMVSGTRCP